MAIVIGASIVTAAAVAAQLLVGRYLLDLLAEDQRVSTSELAPGLFLLGALLVVGALSQAVNNEIRVLLAERVHRSAMDDVLDVATEVGYEAFEETDFHDRLMRARVATGGQSSAVVFGFVTILSTVIITAGVVIVLLAVVPYLLPIALLGYLPILAVNARNTRARYRFEVELTELQRERGYLEMLMTERVVAKEVRSYETTSALRRWHGEIWDTRMSRLGKLVRERLARNLVGSLVSTAATVATLSIALILAGRGTITIGDAAVAVVALQQLNGRIQSMGTAFNGVYEGVTFLRDFESFHAELPTIREQRPVGTPPSPPSVMTASDLGYRYPSSHRDALGNVSFELRRGQIMAIVGSNGSGKSTLAKLVCGILTPTRGDVYWDGVPLSTCDPSLVRAQIAPVYQDFVPYYTTIRRAVGLGDITRLDDTEGIRRAIDGAGLGEFVDGLPAGLDTRLGKVFQAGIDVSGGQWQRLAIARALFRDAPVLVLDEPSASLDPQAEAELFDLLHDLCRDRIVVFVSHRFNTVRSADVVMVLEDGEIVEMGPHHDLMAAEGLYSEMFRLQADRFYTE